MRGQERLRETFRERRAGKATSNPPGARAEIAFRHGSNIVDTPTCRYRRQNFQVCFTRNLGIALDRATNYRKKTSKRGKDEKSPSSTKRFPIFRFQFRDGNDASPRFSVARYREICSIDRILGRSFETRLNDRNFSNDKKKGCLRITQLGANKTYKT